MHQSSLGEAALVLALSPRPTGEICRDPLLASVARQSSGCSSSRGPFGFFSRWITASALYAARPGQLPPLWTVEACPSLPSLLAGVYPAMS
jgi:hypothetical protein